MVKKEILHWKIRTIIMAKDGRSTAICIAICDMAGEQIIPTAKKGTKECRLGSYEMGLTPTLLESGMHVLSPEEVSRAADSVTSSTCETW